MSDFDDYQFGDLTDWGISIQILRGQKDIDIMEMADDLDVSITYLISVECGLKSSPEFIKRCEDYLASLPDSPDKIVFSGSHYLDYPLDHPAMDLYYSDIYLKQYSDIE